MCHSIPYEKYTKLTTIHLVIGVIRWIGLFSSQNGISSTSSASSNVEGKNFPYGNIKRITFGYYALAYTSTINNISKRYMPAIALRDSNELGDNLLCLCSLKERYTA